MNKTQDRDETRYGARVVGYLYIPTSVRNHCAAISKPAHFGNAPGVRDYNSLPPVGPHGLLLSHRAAATAAHRGLEQLERVLVDRSAIFLGNSKEAVTLGGDEVQPVVVLLEYSRVGCGSRQGSGTANVG